MFRGVANCGSNKSKKKKKCVKDSKLEGISIDCVTKIGGNIDALVAYLVTTGIQEELASSFILRCTAQRSFEDFINDLITADLNGDGILSLAEFHIMELQLNIENDNV